MILMYDFCKMNKCKHLKYVEKQCYKCDFIAQGDNLFYIHKDLDNCNSIVNYYRHNSDLLGILGNIRKCVKHDILKQTVAMEKL